MKKSSQNNLSVLLIVFSVFLIVKLLWTVIEINFLPIYGVDHLDMKEIKSLYYKVKLANTHKPKKVKKTKVEKNTVNVKDIKLLAIYKTSQDIIITVKYKTKTKVLTKGDKINGLTLDDATLNSAFFVKNNQRYKVDLVKTIKSNTSIVPINHNPDNLKETKADISDEGDYKVIDKKVFDHFVNNMDDIYKNIGINEETKGDKKVFKISYIKRGSVFAKLGLKRGDILKSVNGENVDSYVAAFRIYQNMKDVDNITIVIERNHKEMELEYEIN